MKKIFLIAFTVLVQFTVNAKNEYSSTSQANDSTLKTFVVLNLNGVWKSGMAVLKNDISLLSQINEKLIIGGKLGWQEYGSWEKKYFIAPVCRYKFSDKASTHFLEWDIKAEYMKVKGVNVTDYWFSTRESKELKYWATSTMMYLGYMHQIGKSKFGMEYKFGIGADIHRFVNGVVSTEYNWYYTDVDRLADPSIAVGETDSELGKYGIWFSHYFQIGLHYYFN